MKDYAYIFVPFVSLIICQLIKFTIESLKYKQLQWTRLFNGVRFESGKQAAAINDIVDELGKHRRKKLNIDILKEQLGHKLSEVVGGVILGFATGSIFYFLLW